MQFIILDEAGRTSKQESSIHELEPDLPPLPCHPEPSCSYSSMCTTFADGMIIAFSTSLPQVDDKSKTDLNKNLSGILKEPSDVAPQASNSVPPPKSPKGKRTKKDDDTKLQEEAEKQQQEAENAKKLLQRQKEIIKIAKELEDVKNLYITSSDGLHVSFLHNIMVNNFEDLTQNENTFVLKQEHILNKTDEVTLESREAVLEQYRWITDEGKVIKVYYSCTFIYDLILIFDKRNFLFIFILQCLVVVA